MHSVKPRGVSASIIGAACAVALLHYGRAFLVTMCTAVIVAFILEPSVVLLMRLRIPRALASFVVCSLAVCVLYLAGFAVYTQVAGVVDEFPKYGQRIDDLTGQVVSKMEEIERWMGEVIVPKRFREQKAQAPPQPPQAKQPSRRKRAAEPVLPPAPAPSEGTVQEVRIRPERPPLVDFAYSLIGSVYQFLLMASFVPFLVYFMLSWRDHIHRSFLLLFEEQGRIVAGRALDGIAGIVRAFVVGNSLLGILLAALTILVFGLFRLPYPFLLGAISGFLTLVPYVGLPLALLPALLGALAVYNTMTPYIAILTIVAVLHLIGMNLLYPKIVGTRVHLNPLVVTVALMFWSVIWGAAGLILAIPLTAGLKAVCDNVKQLEPYGRLLGD